MSNRRQFLKNMALAGAAAATAGSLQSMRSATDADVRQAL